MSATSPDRERASNPCVHRPQIALMVVASCSAPTLSDHFLQPVAGRLEVAATAILLAWHEISRPAPFHAAAAGASSDGLGKARAPVQPRSDLPCPRCRARMLREPQP